MEFIYTGSNLSTWESMEGHIDRKWKGEIEFSTVGFGILDEASDVHCASD